jgi:hypothetical protein
MMAFIGDNLGSLFGGLFLGKKSKSGDYLQSVDKAKGVSYSSIASVALEKLQPAIEKQMMQGIAEYSYYKQKEKQMDYYTGFEKKDSGYSSITLSSNTSPTITITGPAQEVPDPAQVEQQQLQHDQYVMASAYGAYQTCASPADLYKNTVWTSTPKALAWMQGLQPAVPKEEPAPPPPKPALKKGEDDG